MEMTREEEIKQAAIQCGCIENTAEYFGFLQGARFADRSPDNKWHKIEEELPALDPTMTSRGFNMSLPVLLCDIDSLTAYAGTRYHYDPARYDFDKKQWEDIIGYCDEELGITQTHWMYQPEPPKGSES